MRFLLALLPAAACAVAMFLCFRMMRHSEMPADGHAQYDDDVGALRKELADLRQELARARTVQPGAAAVTGRRIDGRSVSETTPLSTPTSADAASAAGHPDG